MLKIDYEFIEKARNDYKTHEIRALNFQGTLTYLRDLSRDVGIEVFLGKEGNDCFFFTGGGYAIAKIDENLLEAKYYTKTKFYDVIARYMASDKEYIDHMPITLFNKEFCKKYSEYYKKNLFKELYANSKLTLAEKKKIFKTDTKKIDAKLKKNNKTKNRYSPERAK